MPAAYSLDLRERVTGTVEDGVSRRRAAAVFKVSISAVIRWVKRVPETGSCAPLPSGGHHKSKDVEAHKDWLLSVITAEPDLTLEEIQGRLMATHDLPKSQSCLWRFLARHDPTFKKTAHAAKQDRPDVKRAREIWGENQHTLIRSVSSSWTKPASARTSAAFAGAARVASG
jgi:transposase